MQVDIESMERWTARLGPEGAARWFQVAFLSVWLCGWALGEAFAGFIVFATPVSAALGLGFEAAPPLFVWLFLAFWFTMWTFGGVSAIRQWLRLVWSSDEIEASPTAVTVRWRVGPFRRARQIARAEILSVYEGGGKLMIDTPTGPVELTAFGTPADRHRLVGDLRLTLALTG